MKITAILLLVTALQVSANGFSQSITLSVKDASLESVFKEIRKQSGYNFLFSYDELDKAMPVTIQVKEATLEEVLTKCFTNQPLSYSIVDKVVIVKKREEVADHAISNRSLFIDIKGIISNEKGEPVIATVTIKGTDISVTSNTKGEFVLKGVNENAVLVITGVNLETREIKVDGKINLEISVKTKVKEEKEVIVTAYGIEKSTKELGYSAVKVSGEDINRANPGNLLMGLTGRVSGLNISQQSSGMNPQMRVLLRGIRSISESTNNLPLFILNGAPLSFGSDQVSASLVMDFVNNINPVDIEDVTVLKGANGTALYGPEGVNGVIIITTKKGNKGSPSINFRNHTSFQKLDFRYVTFQTQFGSGTGGVDQFGNGVYDPMGFNGWGPAYNGQLVPIGFEDENGDIQRVPYSYTKDRFHFFSVAKQVQNSLSITQADSKSDFYLGLNYANQSGLIPKDVQNRASILLNTARQVGKLNVRTNIAYTRTNGNYGAPQSTVLSLPAHIRITHYKDYVNDHWSDQNHYPMNGENPYANIDRVRAKTTENALFGNLTFTVKPNNWLTLIARPGINYSGYYEKETAAPINFSDFAKMFGGGFRRKDWLASVKEKMVSTTALNSDFLVSTLHNTGNLLIRTSTGATIRENYTKSIRAAALSLAAPVFNLDFNSLPPGVEERAVLSRFYSLFGTGTIGYKDRIFLEITGRNDWDSKLAKIARNKNFYYGANTSVVLTEVIPSLSKINWLTSARIRASVTRTANMNIEPYQAERLFTLTAPFPYNSLLSYNLLRGGYPNPMLKPEKIISLEYGGNFSLLKDRIVFDVAYYRQQNNGLILKVNNGWLSTAPTIDNAGKFANFGWEFDLKLNPVFKLPNSMSFTAEGRFSFNNNKVLELSPVYDGRLQATETAGMPGAAMTARTGHSAYEYEVFDWLRDPSGRVIVDRVTGMPSVDRSHPVVTGRSLPKYTAAVNFNFSWKKFTLTALAEYRGGNQVFAAQQQNMIKNGLHPLTTLNGRQRFVFPNSVVDNGSGHYTENTDVLVSSAGQEFYALVAQANIHFLNSADFWKIREIAISYEIPFKSKWAKKVGFNFYIRDPFSFYPKSNISGDPLLIRGPGDRPYQTIQSNLSGAYSEVGRLPGTVLCGFITNISF
ncbi:SusC/RagA family TonB-linked outer membrane protein [Niastella vici]|nr:SusC/RagA family TonB-linked outer membrane protein [Niastella vici]